MTILSQTKFAVECGVTKQAISLAVKRGDIVRTRKGIDIQEPVNKKYLIEKKSARMAETRQKGVRDIEERSKAEGVQPKRRGDQKNNAGGTGGKKKYTAAQIRGQQSQLKTDEEYDRIASDAGRGKDLDNKLKAVKLSKEKLAYFHSTKKSVPATLVMRAFTRLAAVLEDHFRSLDERLGDDLYAMALAGVTKEVFAEKLRTEIDRGVSSILKLVKKEVEKLRDEQK